MTPKEWLTGLAWEPSDEFSFGRKKHIIWATNKGGIGIFWDPISLETTIHFFLTDTSIEMQNIIYCNFNDLKSYHLNKTIKQLFLAIEE